MKKLKVQGTCLCKSTKWSFDGALDRKVTACNCSACSRFGALWVYGHIDNEITLTGETRSYERGDHMLEFHSCLTCSNLVFWKSKSISENNKTRCAVNLRLCEEYDKIASLPIDHFDGLKSFESLPSKNMLVKDLWF